MIDPMLSASALTLELKRVLGETVNVETARRILRRGDLHGRISRKKPLVTRIEKLTFTLH